ncbi:MAG: SMP-30/gluconolactonase/LRE family protein [Chitinophagaceae bacterium]|nr:SMP-30/gluconolactonase/LRE family protein [Oligoflexus sp.]
MNNAKQPSRKVSLLLFFVLVVSGISLKTLGDAGELDTIWDHPLPDCHLVTGVTGAEDMASVDKGTRVLVSATDRQQLHPGQKSGIYIYDGVSNPRLIFETNGDPEGISAVETETGTRVFVVVHQKTTDAVQIFNWIKATDSLQLDKEVSFDGVTALNGIVGLDANRFYVTQELGMPFSLARDVEKLLRLPLGKLWFYDGKNVSVARDKISYPNGLALSRDRKILYLASMLSSSLIVFDLDSVSGDLHWRDQIVLHTAPDNLKWAGESLLIGAHPQLLHLFGHSHDARAIQSPSQLISLEGLPDKPRIIELYSSREGPLNAITGGTPLGQRLIMGSVYDEGILNCGTKP